MPTPRKNPRAPAPPLTQADLDRLDCGEPDCEHDHSEVIIMQACHPDSGLDVCYSKLTGQAKITCRRCGGVAASLAVAESHLVAS